MVTWEEAEELALALPEVEEGTSYGQPAFRVAGKTFAWMSPHEEGAFALRVEPEERPLMIESAPDAYFVTPHYEGHPIVLVHLGAIEREELRERLADAWLLRAPPKLRATFR